MLDGIVAGAALLLLLSSCSSVLHSVEGAFVDTLHELVLSVRVGSRLVITLKDTFVSCQ